MIEFHILYVMLWSADFLCNLKRNDTLKKRERGYRYIHTPHRLAVDAMSNFIFGVQLKTRKRKNMDIKKNIIFILLLLRENVFKCTIERKLGKMLVLLLEKIFI